MDIGALAYPDSFTLDGTSFKGRRDGETVSIPYTEAPAVHAGALIAQETGNATIELQIVDLQFLTAGSMGLGTKHPHLLRLKVRNITAEKFAGSSPGPIHIGSITGAQVQVGNHNHQSAQITLEALVSKIAEQGDHEAKGLMRKLLENNSVAAVIGAGAAGLITALGG